MEIPYPLYFPALHPELADAATPENIRFLLPGISLPTPYTGMEKRFYTPGALPFMGRDATLLLQELLNMGSDMATSQGVLERLPAQPSSYSSRSADPNELDALRLFQESGTFNSLGASRLPSKEEDPVAAQKLLLLLWQHEENALQLKKIQQDLKDKETELWSELEQGREQDELRPAWSAERLFEEKSDLPCSWETVLKAMLPFIPSDSILFCNTPGMLEKLSKAGLIQHLPAELEIKLFGSVINTSGKKFYSAAAAWLILGLQAQPENALMFHKNLRIIICEPS